MWILLGTLAYSYPTDGMDDPSLDQSQSQAHVEQPTRGGDYLFVAAFGLVAVAGLVGLLVWHRTPSGDQSA